MIQMYKGMFPKKNKTDSINILVLVLGFKSNCPLVQPRIIGSTPSVGVFLRDPKPYLREFRKKTRETPNG